MRTSYLLHHLIFANKDKNAVALKYNKAELKYKNLESEVVAFAKALVKHKIEKQERIAIYLEKRFEFVIASFGSACAANIFIPINPILKKDQVNHILQDAQARVLVISVDRFKTLAAMLDDSSALELVVLLDGKENLEELKKLQNIICKKTIQILSWQEFMGKVPIITEVDTEYSVRSAIDTEAVSIFYTSGSTGKPKGVVLSHRNMVFGAKNVSSYLELTSSDCLLAALPLSFDAGFSQLTTAFHSSASVVLLNYIVANDILKIFSEEKITGLTAVPPLWLQLAPLSWPTQLTSSLRFFANTGGKMPQTTLQQLRVHFPMAKPYLMFGLTESFRSTYLPPDQVDKRPNSIGKAIPNAEILILHADGTPCKANEPGELIHRGALVGLGYWNDPVKTAERYRPLLVQSRVRPREIVLPEIVVYSGDIVSKDEEGFIYYIGRNDEMIKTSGYRVSPMEVEEVIYQIEAIQEVAVFSLPHPRLEQGIVAVIKVSPDLSEEQINNKKQEVQKHCQLKLPLYMQPLELVLTTQTLPRNQNGKIDRKLIAHNNKERIVFV